MLTAVLLEQEGSDMARVSLVFKYLLEPEFLFCFVFLWVGGSVQTIIPFTVSYNECLDVAVSQFTDARAFLLDTRQCLRRPPRP